MADVKISDLTADTAPLSTALVETETALGASKKVTLANLQKGMVAGSNTQVQFNDGGSFGGANLWREDADTIAQRNSTTTQVAYWYSTYTDASNYERLAIIPGAASGWQQVAAQTAGTGTDNIGIALTPAGTGAISAHVPDSTTAGGNTRGTNAVDWQTFRSAATRVASGAYSFIGAGSENTASGSSAIVVGGLSNSATNSHSVILGGRLGNATGSYTVIAGGFQNTASGQYSSVLGGFTNTADGVNSWIPGGLYAVTRNVVSAGAYGMTQRAAPGDRQTMVLPIACAACTDDTPTVMTSNAGAAAATNQMALPNNSSMFFEVDVVAHDSSLKSASWKIQGTIRRGANAAATTIVGTNVTTTFGSDLSGGSPGVTATADTTNGALQITFTGIAATTIYASGHIRTVIAA